MSTFRWILKVPGPLQQLAVEMREGRLWSLAPPAAGESLEDGRQAAARQARAADRRLRAWFSGTVRGLDELRLARRGTDFQNEVWAAARAIPTGQTRTYAQLASEIGRPGAARAVGSALGANPWLVVVPCHRVIRGDGSLAGFAYGLEAKRWLLAHEAGIGPEGGAQ